MKKIMDMSVLIGLPCALMSVTFAGLYIALTLPIGDGLIPYCSVAVLSYLIGNALLSEDYIKLFNDSKAYTTKRNGDE